MQGVLDGATLATTHLWFTARVLTPLWLDTHSGASLRGSFFQAVWSRFCTNKEAQSCSACMLHDMCPVSTLVAPLSEDSSWGQDIPRPYVIIPPQDGEKRYAPGERFGFGITLFGNIVHLLPYIMLSISQLERDGLGLRVPENNGQRGRYKVEMVEAYHPFTGERVALYKEGETHVHTPAIRVEAEECQQRAERLSPDRVELEFVTPLRLIDRERLVKQATFRPLLQRLLERYQSLERYYGNAEFEIERAQKEELMLQAEQVQCSSDQTKWYELKSYSNRQKRATPIGGLVGRATFEGDLRAMLPLLVRGELIHVGKNVVKGSGWYRILETH